MHPPDPRQLPHRPSTPAGSVRSLLRQAQVALSDAHYEHRPADRYVYAHTAALRAAAALLALRGKPGRRTKPTSVWVLLAKVAPELAEWADLFAAGSARRHAAQTGVNRAVPQRDADDLLRQSEQFLGIIERSISGDER
ncbi:chromosome segregation protein SMC [Pseudonocardiaceae bacterium YIM PH 21723]|nr:chromosome segregation protein SMC [Pseudonocardiaceae bacterium YIM PH 21723]